jgi:hypothetical protein
MTNLARTTLRVAVLMLALATGVVAPARAQDAALDREQLTRYAQAYLALDSARAEFHAAIARIHDDVGLGHARTELDAKVSRIYLDHQFTVEQYGSITLLISQNEQVKGVFEGIVSQLRATAGTP